MMIRFAYAAILCLGIAWLAGCQKSDEGQSHTTGAGATSSSAPVVSSSAPAVELKTVSCDQWDQEFATKRGNIVVVDTWATTCAPCVEEFPHLVELHGKYADRGVVCMSVSVDELTDRDAALQFLARTNASFRNFIIDDQEYAWWDKWDIKAIPVVLVFDPQGALVRKFDKDDPDNQFTYADVEKLVVEMLDAPLKPNGSPGA